MQKFNPAPYVQTASETLDKLRAREKFVETNGHLALKFPIEGLEEKIPPIQLGEVGLIGGKSHHGKSLLMKYWLWDAQKKLEETERRAMIAYVSHEDTGEMTAAQMVKRYGGNETAYEDDLFVYIGRSFGMKPEEIADMYMSNIIRALKFAKDSKFAEPMPFAAVGYDFIQKTPPDPERRMMQNDSQRRLQIADDSKRLGDGAVYLSCPILVAAQAGLKNLNSPYADKMPIPGDGDFEEAKEIFQYADHAITIWHPARTYPIGFEVESGYWKFKVREDLFFIRHLKARYCDPHDWKGIGRVYPVRVQSDGTFTYDQDHHKSLLTIGDSDD